MVVRDYVTTKDKHRVNTGPLQIDDDWCGFFLRGDDAFHLRNVLLRVSKSDNNIDSFTKLQIQTYADKIKECQEWQKND